MTDLNSYRGTEMTPLAHIKFLLQSGDVAGAETLCKKAFVENPDDVAVRFLHATCLRLLGDEETFRHIMLEIAPQMEVMAKADPDCEAAKLWRKSGAVLMEYVVLGVLIVAAVIGGVVIFGEQIQDRYLYGPAIDRKDMVCTLYGPAIEIDRVVEPQPTNGVAPTAETSDQPPQTESETP